MANSLMCRASTNRFPGFFPTCPRREPGNKVGPIRGCAAGQGMVFDLSVLNRVYNYTEEKYDVTLPW